MSGATDQPEKKKTGGKIEQFISGLPPSKKRLTAAIFIISFCLLLCLRNGSFIQRDSGPKFTDNHLSIALRTYDFFQKGDAYRETDGKLMKLYDYYPPLFYLVSQLTLKPLGFSYESGRLAQLIFVMIFLPALFGIGYEYGGYWSGAAVMALGAASPHILNLSTEFLLDFPAAAMTAAAFYFLLKSDGFANTRTSIPAGIFLALAVLIKWSTVFFLALPVIWFLLAALYRTRKDIISIVLLIVPAALSVFLSIRYYESLKITPGVFIESAPDWFSKFLLFGLLPPLFAAVILTLRKIKQKGDDSHASASPANFAYFWLAFALTALPWYFYMALKLKNSFQMSMFPRNISGNLAYMLKVLFTGYSFIPVFIIIGLVFMLIRFREKLFYRLLLPINSVAVFYLLVHMALPSGRHLLPLIVFLAALGGFWVSLSGTFRPYITVLILIISVLAMSAGMVIPSSLPIFRQVNSIAIGPQQLFSPEIFAPVPPRTVRYETSDAFDYLFNDRPEGDTAVINYYQRVPFFDREYFRIEIYKRNGKLNRLQILDAVLEPAGTAFFDTGRLVNTPDLKNRISNTGSFLIIHEEERSPEAVVTTLRETFPEKQASFKSFEAGDGFKITVLKLQKENGN